MSIEQLLAENTAALRENTETVQKLIAGRDAALAKLEEKVAAGEAKPARASRKKADAEAGNAATDAATDSPASTSPEPSAQSSAPAAAPAIDQTITDAVTGYLKGTEDEAERKVRTGDITSIMSHFGGKLVGPHSTLDADQKVQALFYVRRFAAGCEVNFSQDYDFSGDPAQGAAPAVTVEGEEDEFAIG